MAEQRLKIHEIFYSIQGESTFAGRPCVLVRLTGCQMRCAWCDTEYAFYEGAWRSRAEVVAEVASHSCPLVEITGGEPLLQPAARPLMVDLCDAGYEVLLETGGGVDIGDVDPRVRRIVDVKGPGSGEAEKVVILSEDHALLAVQIDLQLACESADRPLFSLAAVACRGGGEAGEPTAGSGPVAGEHVEPRQAHSGGHDVEVADEPAEVAGGAELLHVDQDGRRHPE